jgi:HSP20 family protein
VNYSDTENKKNDSSSQPSGKASAEAVNNLGGLLGGVGRLIERLNELAQAEAEIIQSGENVHGVYGINVHTSLNESGRLELKVEPFGNVRRGPNEKLDDDVREPLAEVREERNGTSVMVEVPGVVSEDVEVKAGGGRLNILAKRDATTYRKEIVLPKKCDPELMSWECANGILKVTFDWRNGIT